MATLVLALGLLLGVPATAWAGQGAEPAPTPGARGIPPASRPDEAEAGSVRGAAAADGFPQEARILPEPSRTRFVSPGAAPGGDGTEGNPLADLAAALALLVPGDRLVLLPGVYAGSFSIDERCRSGEGPGRPIQVVAQPGALLRGGGGREPVLLVKMDHWAFAGLDVSPGEGGAVAIATLGAKGITLLDAHVHDGPRNGIAIGPGSTDVTISGCRVHGFDAGDRDAHGIAVLAGTRNVVVRGSDIHHNSGDAVQVIGPEQSPGALPPAEDVLIEGNALHEDRENAVDVKTARRVRIAGNRMWGYRPVATSHGEAVLIHNGAEDVAVEGNAISRSAIGVSVGRGVLPGGAVTGTPRHVEIAGNTIESGAADDATIGIAVAIAKDVTISDNLLRGFGTGLSLLGREGEIESIAIIGNTIEGPRRLAFRISRLSAASRFEGNTFAGLAEGLRCRVGEDIGGLPSLVASGFLPGNLVRVESAAGEVPEDRTP